MNTKRFTSKEKKRRVVVSIYDSSLPSKLVGFENHLNLFHVDQKGFSKDLATGLSIYLNITFVDRLFRQFNSHTQVNATDLRSLRYLSRETLVRIGNNVQDSVLSQALIDNIIEEELASMTDDENPLLAQQKNR